MENFFNRLRPEHQFLPFNCGDEDLNNYLRNDAIQYQNQLLSVTYYGIRDSKLAFFFSLSNDKISALETSSSFWRKIKSLLPHSKHRKDYPAVKIGRLGVDLQFQRSDLRIGSLIIDSIKESLTTNNKTGCRFLTVDAYRGAVPFYQKNGFDFMGSSERTRYSVGKANTISMYYDLMRE